MIDISINIVIKIFIITAITTIVSVVLTPAIGVITEQIVGGGTISGDILGQAGEAAMQGLKNLADPTKFAKKVITKTITKGKDIPGTDR